MRGICSTLLILALFPKCQEVAAQPAASRVLIPRDRADDLLHLHAHGLALSHLGVRGDSLVADLGAGDIALLRQEGIRFRVAIEDLPAYYAEKLTALSAMPTPAAKTLASEFPVRGMRLGSQTLTGSGDREVPTGMYTLEEVAAVVDSLQEAHPRLMSGRETIGHSFEGRPIWMVKISEEPEADLPEPEILYTAALHGDEPMGVMALVYFMHYLLEQYGENPRVTGIVQSRELYFVPVVNPDGYEKVWRLNTNRDEERPGVDLNRNFGFEWDGEAPFYGSGPFSELETQALRDLCLEREFRLALNYHDFILPILLHPWGHGKYTSLPDSSTYDVLGGRMTEANGYPYGQTAVVLYSAPGNSDDWMYGETEAKGKTFALSPEIGAGKFPIPDSIFIYTQRMLDMNLVFAEGPGVLPPPETIALPGSLSGISGDGQEGPIGAELADPLVVEVRDRGGNLLEGVQVTFAVTAGAGTLSAEAATTDSSGRAASRLTLGWHPGTNTVEVTAPELGPLTFSATGRASPDFDGDGAIGFSDFFLFADAFGSADARFDLDGSGSVDFTDFFLLADHFVPPARAKLLVLARESIGLPDGPRLQQNTPNPFNSRTVIPYFLPESGPVQVEIFALTGQRVAVLARERRKAPGRHRLHWDGRDDEGRPLGSGVYFCRLTSGQRVLTRRLTLLR